MPWGLATNCQATPDSRASFALQMQQFERVTLQLTAMCEQSHDRAAVGKKGKRRTVASAMAKIAEMGALCANFDVLYFGLLRASHISEESQSAEVEHVALFNSKLTISWKCPFL